MIVQLHDPAALLRRKAPAIGAQTLSEHFGEEKNLLLSEIEL